MSISLKWMPLYVRDYDEDTAHLTCEQDGAYGRLLRKMWLRGDLPNDDAALARIAGVTRTYWVRHIKPAIMPLMMITKIGTVSQKRLQNERWKVEVVSRKRAENARKMWEKRDTIGSINNDLDDATASAVQNVSGSDQKPDLGSVPDQKPAKNFGKLFENDPTVSRENNGLGCAIARTTTIVSKKKEEGTPSTYRDLPLLIPEPTHSASPGEEKLPDNPVNGKDRKDWGGERVAVMVAWNTMAGHTGRPVIKSIVGNRANHLNARLREHGLDGMLQAVKAVGESDLCLGLKTQWRGADFDWAIEPTKCRRLIEGLYANGEKKTDIWDTLKPNHIKDPTYDNGGREYTNGITISGEAGADDSVADLSRRWGCGD